MSPGELKGSWTCVVHHSLKADTEMVQSLEGLQFRHQPKSEFTCVPATAKAQTPILDQRGEKGEAHP